jgi:hypothetical protein
MREHHRGLPMSCCHGIQKKKTSAKWTSLSVLVLLIIPKCPGCWFAYAALLNATGLGFLSHTVLVLPLLSLLLLTTLLSIRRLGVLPFCVTLLAELLVVSGIFYWHLRWVTWTGILLLMGVTLWNLFQVARGVRRGTGAPEVVA